ncbi:MAG TPA: cytochrome c oxidase assembly protein [Solirubrobacteraceae bacterium]|nr:cytochrome c oxidase assembly protein [Solirubrobacteraceae bacterium]
MPTDVLATSTALQALIQLGPLALLGFAYARRVQTLGRQRRPVPGWRQACFYGGFITIGAALTSLGNDSQELLTAHMVEHLLLGDIAALLIVLGLTGPLIAPILRVGIFDRLRILAHPLIAFPLWAIDLYVWHLPTLYEAALRHSWVHALEHAMFLGFGVNMWMCLFGPLPMPSWFGNLAKLCYIVAVRLTATVLGNVFLWSGTVFYPFYTHGDAVWHVSPIADQNLAGAVMMVEESILTLCLFCWLFLRTARQGEERQDLLDFANARGWPLSEERATRAVSAGRGPALRRRMEEEQPLTSPRTGQPLGSPEQEQPPASPQGSPEQEQPRASPRTEQPLSSSRAEARRARFPGG